MLEFIHLPQNLLFDIGLILIVAAIIGYVLRVFRQPLIPAYIIAGVVLGPLALGIIKDVELIRTISEIGILFLLFIVGMEMDLRKLKSVGLASLVTGSFQVILTFFAGFFAAGLLGFDTLNSVYAGLMIAFSSTMIVIKLLQDKEEIHTLHGRIIIGILFLQDIFVILALTLLIGVDSFSVASVFPILLRFIALLVIAFLVQRFIALRLFRFAAKSSELMFLLAVAFCFAFAFLAELFGFSIAIGGFIGGLTLASLPYHLNIIARVSPLKDFFATIFFVSLGLQLAFANFALLFTPLLVFLALVLFFKPFIIMVCLSLFGYDKRNAFVSAVSLAQISEFSLILVMSVSDISSTLFSVGILLGVLSIGLTAYIMKYEMFVYNKISPLLSVFEKLSKRHKQLGFEYSDKKKIILFGCHRIGSTFLKSFSQVKKHVLVIDFNPEVIEKLKEQKVSSLYGDMSNRDILKRIDFSSAKVIVSTVAREEDTLRLLKYLQDIKKRALVFVTAANLEEALNLYDAGADYVILPQIMSGEKIAEVLERCLKDKKRVRKLKREHLKHLLEMHAEQ